MAPHTEFTTSEGMTFGELVLSDHAVAKPGESRRRLLLMALPRLLVNPSLQLAFLVRVAQRGPRLLQYPVRLLQVLFFSSEIYWFNRPNGIELGPGVSFPHPWGIGLGAGLRIGRNVTIYQSTTIGTDRNFVGDVAERSPTLGDRSVIYSYAMLLGKFTVGHDAVVGVRVMLDDDVPPGALRTVNGQRLAGEWPGEGRWHRDPRPAQATTGARPSC